MNHEQDTLRPQLIAQAEVDLVKSLDPHDPDIEFKHGLAKEVAVDLVDLVVARLKHEDDLRIEHHCSRVQPSDFREVLAKRVAALRAGGFLATDTESKGST